MRGQIDPLSLALKACPGTAPDHGRPREPVCERGHWPALPAFNQATGGR
ncbi:MAG TPA: hypothetical protein PL078_06135 [Bacillota bacterium]|nr:hypothetical protein [Peptococcaceae bacterium MAG4]HPU35546.1 hypothetical protein [Bacillota bacterium]HPZ43568.1 hypothetical protein [Bacillota bacterium]HQD75968.1 hypothetical protein [Bacillota bacterium]HUM58297.1 hypothetical protein [Bacillota bacterium]